MLRQLEKKLKKQAKQVTVREKTGMWGYKATSLSLPCLASPALCPVLPLRPLPLPFSAVPCPLPSSLPPPSRAQNPPSSSRLPRGSATREHDLRTQARRGESLSLTERRAITLMSGGISRSPELPLH